jgi:uncharacterized membrane protein (DUF2068 family)
MSEKTQSSGVIVAIGAFKLVKAVLLVLAGLAALKVVRGDLAQMIDSLLRVAPVAPARALIERVAARVSSMDAKKLEEVAFGTFAYAAVFLVEGVGLLLRKTWAEWLTVIVTTSFIPLEIWHLVREPSAGTVVTIAVNAAIVVYLLLRLLHGKKT